MLEVGRVERARRQDGQARLLGRYRGQGRQRLAQAGRVVVDLTHVRLAEDPRQDALEHLAVLEHVGHARGHAQVVLQHAERAVQAPHEVHSRHVHVHAAGRAEADHLLQPGPRARDQLARHDALVQDALLGVDVREERVQRLHPLHEPALDHGPLARRDHARDRVEREHNQSIGAVTIDPSSPDVVWVGTGEPWTRNSTSVGDGVYRTTDAGDTWTRMGLEDSERISRILVHPDDSDTVWVCATGPALECQRAARRVQDHRRRGELDEGPVRRRGHRLLVARRRPAGPHHPLRGDVAVPPLPRLLRIGWPRQRPLQEHGRRRQLGGADRRPAGGRQGTDRRGGRSQPPQSGLRRRRVGGQDRALPVERSRGHLGGAQLGDERGDAAVLLRPRGRRPPGPRPRLQTGLHAQRQPRRRRELHQPVRRRRLRLHRPPRPPRPLDQPDNPKELLLGTDGGVYQSQDQGVHLAPPEQHAAGAVLPGRLRHGVPLQRLRRPAGQRELDGTVALRGRDRQRRLEEHRVRRRLPRISGQRRAAPDLRRVPGRHDLAHEPADR